MTIPKLTQAQNLLLQGVGSMLIAALVGTGQALTQHYTGATTINVGEAVTYALATFGSFFGTALYLYVPAHTQLEIQAYQDTITTLRARNTMLSNQPTPPTQATPQAVQSALAPLVVIHNLPTNATATPTVYPLQGYSAVSGNNPSPTLIPLPNPQELPVVKASSSEHPPVVSSQAAVQQPQITLPTYNPNADTLPRIQATLAKQGNQ